MSGNKWSDVEYVLEMVPTEFADGLSVEHEEEESKVTAEFWA